MLLHKLTIFHRVVITIVLLLIPIVGLFAYSNQVSQTVVRNEIRDSIGHRLSFLHNRLELQVELVAKGAFQLDEDPILKSFQTVITSETYFDVIDFKRQVEERISIQNNMSDWKTDTTVYFPQNKQVINPYSIRTFDSKHLMDSIYNSWSTHRTGTEDKPRYEFIYRSVDPIFGISNPLQADHIVEKKFSDENLIQMLDDYKASGQGDPFLYHEEHEIIANRSSDNQLIEQVKAVLDNKDLTTSGSFTADLSGQTYQVYFIPDDQLGWTLIDYVPMQEVLSPIVDSKRLFYVSTALLLLMSLFAAFMLYRHVQIPIRTLIRSLRLVQKGEFSSRIHYTRNNEFSFVYQRFNEMIEQIQQLINNVYSAQLRAREAQLKQLQSQINPHFLYNCLYYIVNMARLERLEPIEKMAMNLGDFFKYTTRLEKSDATLEDELKLLENYLEIQKLRMSRIDYRIEVPGQIMKLSIPRLLLQPIVENAVIHGIEPKPGGGLIRITGGINQLHAWVEIEDNGIGMSKERMEKIMQQLKQPVSEDMGYGVWNVNQRLAIRYGQDAGITYRPGHDGGCIVRLIWDPNASSDGEGQ